MPNTIPTRSNNVDAAAEAARRAAETAAKPHTLAPANHTGVNAINPGSTPEIRRPVVTTTTTTGGTSAVPGPAYSVPSTGEPQAIARAFQPEGINKKLIVDGSKLSVAAINASYGYNLTDPMDLTTAQYPLSAKKPVEGVLAAMQAIPGQEQAVAALKVLLSKLPEGFMVKAPWMQYYKHDGTLGTQYLPFSADLREFSALLHSPQLMREDGRPRGVVINTKEHFRQMSVNTNDPAELFSEDRAQLCTTHGGEMIPVVEDDGKQSMAWPNHPYSYGKMGSRGEYGALLNFWSLSNMELGVDPVAKYGAAKWADIEPSYYEQAHTIAALQVGAVDFSSSDPRPDNSDYSFNITELTDEQKIVQYEAALTSKENRAEKLSAWTKYCMEAVRDSVEVGARPINEKSTRRPEGEGRLDPVAFRIFKDMEKTFNDAGGKENPSAGWEALEREGFVDFNRMKQNNCHRVPFKLAHPDADPVSDLKPKGMRTEGFGKNTMTRPVTLGSLVAGHLQVTFPRATLAEQYSGELATALQACGGDAAAQQAVLGGAVAFVKGVEQSVLKAMGDGAKLANPIDVSNPESIIRWFGIAQSAMTQKSVIEGANDKLLGAIHFEDMDRDSQGAVKKLMGAYIAAVADFTLTRPQLNKRLENLDSMAAATVVTYPSYTAVSYDDHGVPTFSAGGGRKGSLASFTPPHILRMSYRRSGDNAGSAGNTATIGWQPLCDAIRGEDVLGDNWKSAIPAGEYADKS